MTKKLSLLLAFFKSLVAQFTSLRALAISANKLSSSSASVLVFIGPVILSIFQLGKKGDFEVPL